MQCQAGVMAPLKLYSCSILHPGCSRQVLGWSSCRLRPGGSASRCVLYYYPVHIEVSCGHPKKGHWAVYIEVIDNYKWERDVGGGLRGSRAPPHLRQ